MNYQRMIELKRSLQERALAESLDLERIQAEHAEFIALRAEHEAEVARQEAERQAKSARDKEIRYHRRTAAEAMAKAELMNVTGVTRRGWTREQLIGIYESMGVPPGGVQ